MTLPAWLYQGSYYANPVYDQPTTDPDLIKKYAPFCE